MRSDSNVQTTMNAASMLAAALLGPEGRSLPQAFVFLPLCYDAAVFIVVVLLSKASLHTEFSCSFPVDSGTTVRVSVTRIVDKKMTKVNVNRQVPDSSCDHDMFLAHFCHPEGILDQIQ
eukprot:751235-Hanusia_phi.AAC.1